MCIGKIPIDSGYDQNVWRIQLIFFYLTFNENVLIKSMMAWCNFIMEARRSQTTLEHLKDVKDCQTWELEGSTVPYRKGVFILLFAVLFRWKKNFGIFSSYTF